MGIVTISMDDALEQQFRQTVKEEVGEGKGTLGAAVQEALQLWIRQKQQEEIAERQLQLLKTGFRLGRYRFDREELHERQH